jgi:hypothetical protein
MHAPPAGRRRARYGVSWSEPPMAIVSAPPYVVAALPRFIEVSRAHTHTHARARTRLARTCVHTCIHARTHAQCLYRCALHAVAHAHASAHARTHAQVRMIDTQALVQMVNVQVRAPLTHARA